MHPFDEWFARVYPDPEPGTRETAIIAWNAAIAAAYFSTCCAKDKFVFDFQYESAVVARDLGELLKKIARQAD